LQQRISEDYVVRMKQHRRSRRARAADREVAARGKQHGRGSEDTGTRRKQARTIRSSGTARKNRWFLYCAFLEVDSGVEETVGVEREAAASAGIESTAGWTLRGETYLDQHQQATNVGPNLTVLHSLEMRMLVLYITFDSPNPTA
jgi:hypothetical protein